MKIDEVGKSFGAMVRTARENQQMTQAALAAQLGKILNKEVNPLAVTRIEAGSRPVPLQEAAALARILNLEIDPLINPAPVRMSRDELAHRAEEVRDQINKMHLEEVRLMTTSASANQGLRQVRTRKAELERELQAVQRAVQRDGDRGEQEHPEAPER
ncbi:helix-turn-helix domain-containing protein [Streptomyces niveus]|uniref:helix-turn-helix domain-containing protein n=1 Tax=Streptomyces niveus TaxID=193462 RepID=UPI00084BC55C|nr:helix-turn-helix transcriptional regulator [Streptomyces niveus]